MLQASRHRIRAIAFRPASIAHSFTSSSTSHVPRPNATLDLDPSMKALLQDVDISLLNYKAHLPEKRELEVLPMSEDTVTDIALPDEDDVQDLARKSPAALFGSRDFRSVTLPTELQSSINVLISEADRPQLHADAKRLFSNESENIENEHWDTQYNARYRSFEQAARHGERDGLAFATVALPAHYSAIYSVFSHLKKRMGPDFEIEHVIDWGAGTGSGFWASGYSFQKPNANDVEFIELASSTLKTYKAVEKRQGLVSIGKRLIRHVEANPVRSSWKKHLRDADMNSVLDGQKTLAMSAFMLTTLQTPLERKQMVKEMWESGAHTIVIIDHNTKAGFEAVAEAREYLLKRGRREHEVTSVESETADPEDNDNEEVPLSFRGSHVLAPCPHDGACPLYVPGGIRLVCGFSQRLQRPPFIRKTKHSGAGHEDIQYSYVVIRRGMRPGRIDSKAGRVGRVGEKELLRESINQQQQPRELVWHEEHDAHSPQTVEIDARTVTYTRPLGDENLEATLRQEAYYWPRLVFSPLKNSGHIILDSCTAEGKIMRMTIPKSQGKQPYYDARKSTWGDLFPHDPKNPPQERCDTAARNSGKGSDIGKRKTARKSKSRASYDEIAADIKQKHNEKRKSRSRSQQLKDID